MAGQLPKEKRQLERHQENYLDQILRRLKSEPEEVPAKPSTLASASMAAAGSGPYPTRALGSTLGVQEALDLGDSGPGPTNPWPFVSSSSVHPGLPSMRKQEPSAQQEGSGQGSELYRIDTPSSSNFLPRDSLISDFPWWMEDLEQRGVGGAAQIGAGPSYSSTFSDRPEDQFGSRAQEFDAELGFRMSPSRLETAAQSAVRGRTSTVVPINESLFGTQLDGPQRERTGCPGSLESMGSIQATYGATIPAAAREPRTDMDPPGAPAGSLSINPETPNSSLSSGSLSEGEDERERQSISSRRPCQHQLPLVNQTKDVASSAKRKTLGCSLDEGEESMKYEPELIKKQQILNRPQKKGGAKRAREPRYAIKTRTDVDIMDDGFKWRKYGQKAVKNSPHPRNYYRCTTPNCPVRKRVERSCEDAGLVITTYEGIHTHQTPGLHRSPSHGFVGDRPLGLGHGGLFVPPASIGAPLAPGAGSSSKQLPAEGLPNFPRSSSNLASLQQADLQTPKQLAAGSKSKSLQAALGAGVLSAQQFSDRQLQDKPSIVKQEDFQFTSSMHQPADFLRRSSSSSSSSCLPLQVPRQNMVQLAQDTMIRSTLNSSSSSSSVAATAAMNQLTSHQQQQQRGGGGSLPMLLGTVLQQPGSSAHEAQGPQAGQPFTAADIDFRTKLQQQIQHQYQQRQQKRKHE